jgi:hypothetical protein
MAARYHGKQKLGNRTGPSPTISRMQAARWWGLLATAALCAGCASSDGGGGDDDASGHQGKHDARVGGGDDAEAPVGDAGPDLGIQREDAAADGAVTPPPDGDVPPGPDMAIGPAPDGGPDHGPRPARLRATVVLTRTPQADTGTASAAITEPIEIAAEPGCRVADVDPNAPPPAAPRGYDGGELTVSGVNGGDLRFRLSGDAAAGFTYAADRNVDDNLFGDGAMLRVTGAGGAHLGPFAVALPAPAAMRISEPREFGVSHDKDDPLPVRWAPAESESLLLLMIPTRPLSTEPERGNWAYCSIPDNGQFDVPPDVLNAVARGGTPLGRGVLLVLTRTRVAQAALGADDVVFTASASHGAAITLR